MFILVDNGRAKLLGSAYQELTCCAASAAARLYEPHCPVYFARRPRLRLGLSGADGPGADAAVAPALKTPPICRTPPPVAKPVAVSVRSASCCQIDAPVTPGAGRARPASVVRAPGIQGWAGGRRPALYRWLTRRAARYLNWLADGDGRIHILGLAPGWTAGRDPPGSSGRTFHELYKARKRA